MRAKTLTVVLMATAFAATGCKRSATGQVVAVVNGEEVSLSELNGELANAPQGGDKQVIRAAALQSLIDRKLLVQQARDRGIDKDPEFLQQQRRANDQLMIAMLGKQLTRNVPVPSSADVDKYLTDHPNLGAGRTLYAVDQVIFAQPQDRAVLKALEPTHTMAAVMAVLDANHIKYARRKDVLDTARAPEALSKQIAALPSGEPFVVGAQGQIVVSAVTDKKSEPLPDDVARRAATEALRRDAVEKIAQKQVKDARASAKIDYQPGFTPSATTPTTAGK